MAVETQPDREVLDRLIKLETLAVQHGAALADLTASVRILLEARAEAKGSNRALAWFISAATAAGAAGSWLFNTFRLK